MVILKERFERNASPVLVWVHTYCLMFQIESPVSRESSPIVRDPRKRHREKNEDDEGENKRQKIKEEKEEDKDEVCKLSTSLPKILRTLDI